MSQKAYHCTTLKIIWDINKKMITVPSDHSTARYYYWWRTKTIILQEGGYLVSELGSNVESFLNGFQA